MSAADRRTVGELLADSDRLARETLLDATPDHAPAMVRSWNQLVGSAAELWAVLPSSPDSPSGLDPMERLRAVGEAIGRSVTAGHWPSLSRCLCKRVVDFVVGSGVPPLWMVCRCSPRSSLDGRFGCPAC